MLLLAAGTAMLINLSTEPWLSVNDDVMGGVSSGGMTTISEGLRFQGNLSLENNGGFSSVRRQFREDLTGTAGIRISVRGDGRRYQLRLRQDRQFDGVAWSVEFDTTGQWQVLDFSYAEFQPVFRGRRVPSAGAVEPGSIAQIGVLVADKNPGSFYLDIGYIELLTLGQD